jgi:hypothetical protein
LTSLHYGAAMAAPQSGREPAEPIASTTEFKAFANQHTDEIPVTGRGTGRRSASVGLVAAVVLALLLLGVVVVLLTV